MYTNDFLQARAGAKDRRYKEEYATVGTAFAPAIVSVTGQNSFRVSLSLVGIG